MSARVEFLDGAGRSDRQPLSGTPQQIVDDIRRYQEVRAVELRLDTAAASVEEMSRTWERFVDEVRSKV